MDNTYKTPISLTCNVTGRVVKYYHRPYIDALIAKHGSLDNLIKNFKCKGVNKGRKVADTKPVTDTKPVDAPAKIARQYKFRDVDDPDAPVIHVYSDV